jgi:hypothetical protein
MSPALQKQMAKRKCGDNYIQTVFSSVQNKDFPCPQCIIFRKELAKSSLKTPLP